ncbi:MAG: M28 family peptidase [Synergistaceae bacterium]|nr:M28 family peptidase [Synergistaceae bacterium]
MRVISRHVKNLSLCDLLERRKALESVLSGEGINYEIKDSQGGIINYEFESGIDSKYLFSAHYDNYRLSCGANDNVAAVCILIDLYHELKSRNISAKFVFTDAEENNHEGAKFFAETHNMKSFAGVINLDLCGYGDSIVINGNIKRLTNKNLLGRHNTELVKFLPESDDKIYRKYNIPVVNISIVPKWDVQYLKALASFGDRLLGQPPEFDLIFSQMEITQTFHGGCKDSPEFIQDSAMQKIFDYLLDSMTYKQEEQEEKISCLKIFSHFITKLRL